MAIKAEARINLTDKSWAGATVEWTQDNGIVNGLAMDRVAAFRLLELLQEYEDNYEQLKPAVLWYNSKEGWSWTGENAGNRFFTRKAIAIRDLELAGFHV